ncbi:MAG: integrase core domain-containing protein [Pirellulales bacterium]
MSRLFQPLLFVLAKCTRNQLIRQIEFLKAENEILRSRIPKKAIYLKVDERKRLLELGKAIGPSLRTLITIVSYTSYLRWLNASKKEEPPKKMGRPKITEDVRELVLKLAGETGWGYTRIIGELKKLGVKPPSKATVQNILRAAELEPGPKRGPGTWEEFLKMHAATLWQADFFSKRVVTRFGIRQMFVLAFINVATRRVIVSPCTRKLGGDWVQRQTESFFEQIAAEGLKADLVMRDNDNVYANGFDQVVKDHGAGVRLTAIRAPNENAYIERFVQSIKSECLDHFLVFGEGHFDFLCREFVDYYHADRPHQGLDNRLIIQRPPPEETAPTVPVGQIECRNRLGGLLKSYYRVAA